MPQEVACFYQLSRAATNLVTMNYCYGSHDKGFVLPLNPCDLEDISKNGIVNNAASVTRTGFLFIGQPNSPCQ